MVRINLLPHREERRKQRQKAFYSLLILGGIIGALIVVAVGGVYAALNAKQDRRNTVIREENKRLDEKIKEIANLKQEIEALKARQQAVEDLQADRNQPVYLMDELVVQTPEGVFIKELKQEGQRVVLQGYAQSNERVSEYLRNLSNHSPWLQRPELIEIKADKLGKGRMEKRVYAFIINVGIKRPRDKVIAEQTNVSAATKPAGKK